MHLQRIVQRSARPGFAALKVTSPSTAAFTVCFAKFHSNSKKTAARATDPITGRVTELAEKVMKASPLELYHYTNMSLAVLTPAALFLSPLPLLNWPVDMGLALVIPVHSYYGLVGVIQDYVPQGQQNVSIMAALVLSILMGLGLLKVNLCGAGVTESVKCLWRPVKAIKE
mmetsp:Transcript_9623/g.14019  ORF Transcript_9623/g.14019 Transcript_9623/m.14019 type:complete len:171 (-) Transcript_9623:39-551(-)|eukprot:CAMPEP_0175104264 /NCGR_PEP_ID=MMETSP0086_2-20121207/9615_1 /TAXON_ID=136419 /ORGANISM="Unknown Unknown, Strain D1" /LENGTH=170 /DNA_ID=CAMNT_0016379605 /DNA_START=24 /DNA_END=536 /DNA_ORIENTATION=-